MMSRPKSISLIEAVTKISFFVLCFTTISDAFSAQPDVSFTLFDRFSANCPADKSCIEQFDTSLVANPNDENDDDDIWVAVYRSANNAPSVLIKDEFLDAMRLATDGGGSGVGGGGVSTPLDDTTSNCITTKAQRRPVAVARLRPSEVYSGQYVIDSLRCSLKKENTDTNCDGGSEYSEALCVAVDELILNYLKGKSSSSSNDSKESDNSSTVRFDHAIRTKSTLFSSKVFEDRGFQPVEDLQKDMATHVSSLDASVEQYALRSVDTSSKTPGGRDRAMQILSFLGRISRDDDIQAGAEEIQNENDAKDDNDDDYDPWATVKGFAAL